MNNGHVNYAPRTVREGVEVLNKIEKTLSQLPKPVITPPPQAIMRVDYNGESVFGECTMHSKEEADRFVKAITSLSFLLPSEAEHDQERTG